MSEITDASQLRDLNSLWRQDWQIDDEPPECELPTAWHRSGLAYQPEYDDIAWIFHHAERSESRAKELELEMGEAAYFEFTKGLYRQLGLLWRERGYTNFSPRKMDGAAAWRADWTLHAGVDAKANAVHSSGLGLTIVTDVDMGVVPVWWAIESEHFADAHARLRREMGADGFDEYLGRRQLEAVELWYELGSENGLCATNVFGTPLDSNARPAPETRQES